MTHWQIGKASERAVIQYLREKGMSPQDIHEDILTADQPNSKAAEKSSKMKPSQED